jgi:hypothetical protein
MPENQTDPKHSPENSGNWANAHGWLSSQAHPQGVNFEKLESLDH